VICETAYVRRSEVPVPQANPPVSPASSHKRAAAPAAATTDDKRALWYLRKIPLFEKLSPEQLRALAAEIEVREIMRRQVIYLPGDLADRVFFINGGRVKCSKVSRDGKELTLAYRGAGEVFGELCVLDDAPRDEMAEAMKNAIITELPAETFRRLLLADAELTFRFAGVVGQRRRQMETKLEHLVFRDVHAKLAALLIDLAEQYGVECEQGTQIGIKITHQEMANLIGSTRETISLTLAHFKKRNLLDLLGRSVVLIDQDGLAALC
jgi:CRP/FNR family cyclic AMP-dependent transcriptional regulator